MIFHERFLVWFSATYIVSLFYFNNIPVSRHAQYIIVILGQFAEAAVIPHPVYFQMESEMEFIQEIPPVIMGTL